MDKCFCHLNGYAVKDAEARNRLDTAENDITLLNRRVDNIDVSGGEGSSLEGIYHIDLPLGLIQAGNNERIENTLSDECRLALLDLMNTKILVDNVDNPIIVIHNTTDSVEVEEDGEVITIENPAPRTAIFRLLSKTEPTDSTMGLYHFSGHDIETNNIHDDVNGTFQSNHLTLNINYTLDETNNFVISDCSIGFVYCNLPSKEDVDEKPAIMVYKSASISTYGDITNSNILARIEREINRKLGSNIVPKIRLYHSYEYRHDLEMPVYEYYSNKLSSTSKTEYIFISLPYLGMYTETNGGKQLYIRKITVTGTWDENNYFTISNAYHGATSYQPLAQMTDVLGKNNTSSYTPKDDYHPATKKYVDDSIASVSGGGSSITIDTEPTSESTNAVSSGGVYTALSNKSNTGHTHTKSEITDFPTIPTKTSDLTNDSGFLTNSDIETVVENSHKVHSGTTEPTTDLGSNGDIYILYEEV